MNLIQLTKSIQRECGVTPIDGKFGAITALAVWARLRRVVMAPESGLDARTQKAIDSLDVNCRPNFVRFALLAQATAATMGCDYIGICGTRTLEEQEQLRRISDAGGPHAAAPGFSWHNFGIAVDFGVFQNEGKIYCDEVRPTVAQAVHQACSMHAKACGLEWGGEWIGKSCDPPHYQFYMGHSSPTAEDRSAYRTEGSVL